MKLKLNKKKLKTLTKDAEVLPAEKTADVAGGMTVFTGSICKIVSHTGCAFSEKCEDTWTL
jgi:hypothetical protein